MRAKEFVVLLIFITGIAGFSACNNGLDVEEEMRQEQRMLDAYLAQNNITVTPTASGLYYIPITQADDRMPDFTSFTDIRYIARLIDGTVFETNIASLAQLHEIYDEDIVYGLTRLYMPFVTVDGIKEGLQLMSVGDSSRLILPSKLGFGGSSLPGIPPYSTLIYDIKLVHEFKDPYVNQTQEIADYLGGFSDLADSTAEGIFIEKYVEGSGDSIGANETALVSLFYDAYFLDGRKWETNRTEAVPQLVTWPEDEEVVPGVIMALKYLKNGSRTRVVLPFRHGYGSHGLLDEHERTLVPYYAPLLYDIEIIAVN